MLSEAASAINSLSEKKGLLIVAISGIDGSGKGYFSKQLENSFFENGISCQIISVDGWLSHPNTRFSKSNPGDNFYKNGIDLEGFKNDIILPLVNCQEVDIKRLEYDASNSENQIERNYQIKGKRVVILEGIFLFRKDLKKLYDYKIWINTSEETSLKRALVRNQEGTSDEQTVSDFEKIYFPAQHIHNKIDSPIKAADLIIDNETNLT